MRKVSILLLVLLLVCPSFLSAQEEEQAATGTLVVYFPEGTGVLSQGGGDPVEMRSGNPVTCEPGTWLLRLTHPDYDMYQETVEIRPGTQVIVVDENRTLRSEAGTLADAFEPLAVHVYEIPQGE